MPQEIKVIFFGAVTNFDIIRFEFLSWRLKEENLLPDRVFYGTSPVVAGNVKALSGKLGLNYHSADRFFCASSLSDKARPGSFLNEVKNSFSAAFADSSKSVNESAARKLLRGGYQRGVKSINILAIATAGRISREMAALGYHRFKIGPGQTAIVPFVTAADRDGEFRSGGEPGFLMFD